MQSNNPEQTFPTDDPTLTEPHFDEEATVLSARPVVPLERVPTRSRINRNWIFAFALAGAVLIGVAGTAIYYSRLLDRITDSTTAANDPQSSTLPEVVAGGAMALPSSVNSDSDAELRAEVKTPVEPAPVIEKETAAPRPAANRTVERRSRPAFEDDDDREKEDRREERRAERKAERQRERELKRERRAARSDDLLRIREIFEGSRRP
ncbi:MAG TPA: hypothetical protein VGW36_03065 [Pyrinomonadaceae bacterium]|nr:hypothetical protein [Pyrinomonadaceae bacterium]